MGYVKFEFNEIINGFSYHKLIYDFRGKPIDIIFIEINNVLEEHFVLNKENIIGKSVMDIIPDNDISWIEEYNEIASTGIGNKFTCYVKNINKWFEINIILSKEGYCALIWNDITQLKLHEEEISRLTGLFEVLSNMNSMLLNLKSSEELFTKTCEIIVKHIDFMLVWIGLNNPETFTVSPVAYSGEPLDYIKNIVIYSDERSEGLGPTGTAIREEKTVVCNDFFASKLTLPWQTAAKLSNIKASAVVPFRVYGKVYGALTIYSTKTNFFQEREIKLMEEMAAGISYGLEHLDKEMKRKQAEQRISYMAYHDYTTDLPNRNLFFDRLKNAIISSKNNDTKLIVIFLDLDNFKTVNDPLGNVIGDGFLIDISKRLLNCIDEKNTVARINGDEFSLLIGDVKPECDISPFIERVISIFKDQFRVNENMVHLTASVGVSIYPDDGDTEEELMNNARIAMYKAKELGKNRYQLFSLKMKEELWQKINIELLLMKAIKNNEFVVYYQPQYTAENRKLKLRGFEALIRWNSPELGFVNPMDFIPIAEKTGLITQIGEWVLNTACTTCKKLEGKYGCDLIMAVNISAIQLRRSEFHEIVLKALEVSNLKPFSLELEVTESIFIDNYDDAANQLRGVKKLGVGIALDDFGTGYSSLSYLRKLPIDLLKIDKSFVHDIDSLQPNNNLTESIINLVKKLKIKTIAEGVETLEQLNYLMDINCDYLQGYYLGKPGPEELMGNIMNYSLISENVLMNNSLNFKK